MRSCLAPLYWSRLGAQQHFLLKLLDFVASLGLGEQRSEICSGPLVTPSYIYGSKSLSG